MYFDHLLRRPERHSHRDFLGAAWIFMPLMKGSDGSIIE